MMPHKGNSPYSTLAEAGILPYRPDFSGKARNLGLLCEMSRLLNVKNKFGFDIFEQLCGVNETCLQTG